MLANAGIIGCTVRCIGGGAGVGQVFVLERNQGTAGPDGGLTLERIERYGQAVRFFDPTDSALVQLSGGAFARLRDGDVLVSHPAPTWQARLEARGLQVLGLDTSPDLPDVHAAILAYAVLLVFTHGRGP